MTSRSVSPETGSRQHNTVDPMPMFDRDEDKELDLVRRLLNDAMDESDWKDELIAAAIGVHPTYLSKLRSGEKPWSLRQITKLPNDIEDRFKKKYAETCPGSIVVQQVSFEEARRQLATGLLSLLTPARAQQAKASLR